MIAALVAIVWFCLDRWTKNWALGHLVLGAPVTVIPGLLDWTLIENRGAAFGLFSGATAVFVLVALGAIVALVLTLLRRPAWPTQLGIGLVLGGALGNLYDRMLTQRVVDFIDVRLWPYVFNVADVGITLGAVLLIALLWRRT